MKFFSWLPYTLSNVSVDRSSSVALADVAAVDSPEEASVGASIFIVLVSVFSAAAVVSVPLTADGAAADEHPAR